MGYVWPRPMPRRNENALKGGNARSSRKGGGGWMRGGGQDRFVAGGDRRADRAPLTPGGMHSQTRRR